MWSLKDDTHEPMYQTETDSQTQRTHLWLPIWSGAGRGIDWEFGIYRYTLSHLEWTMSSCYIQSPLWVKL